MSWISNFLRSIGVPNIAQDLVNAKTASVVKTKIVAGFRKKETVSNMTPLSDLQADLYAQSVLDTLKGIKF